MRTFPGCSDPRRFGAKAYDGVGAETLVKASTGFLEVKAEEGAPDGTITGYGSIFDAVDSYGEATVKGCFKKSLAAWRKSKRPIKMLWNHSSLEPIGGWYDFEEDDVGLKLSGKLNLDVRRAQETWALIKAREIDGLSIGYFEVKADPYDWDGMAEGPRKLYELDLREVSPVTFPALKEAQLDPVKAKRLRGELLTVREFQTALREKMGWSRSFAEDVATLGYKAVLLREQGPDAIPDRAVLEQVREMRSAFEPLVLPTL
jgi:HK97 family phage prohead protease